MQPGDNYRAAASVIREAVETQINQASADALSTTLDPAGKVAPNGDFGEYHVPAVWSQMLTVWRKLHVETDTMVRPTFAQNTFTMPWDEPRQGPAQTQVVFNVDDPASGFQTDDEQFTSGWAELQDGGGNSIVTARVVGYVSNESLFVQDDAVTVNIPNCGNGQSGLACLGGITAGTAILSDDDLSVEATFTAKTWGCDDAYAGPVGSLLPPDLAALQLRYHPAYIDPVQDMAASNVQGLVTFLRNVDFGVNDGKVLWDQALAARDLPVSTPDFWTVMVVSSWQAEEEEDSDPNSEVGQSPGVTKGIGTHKENFLGDTATTSSIGPAYTGICTVFKAVLVGEAGFGGQEQFTVAHEVGHTFGLDHSDGGLMCKSGPCQMDPFTTTSLEKLREYTDP